LIRARAWFTLVIDVRERVGTNELYRCAGERRPSSSARLAEGGPAHAWRTLGIEANFIIAQIHERMAPQVEWIPQLGLSRHCKVQWLQECVSLTKVADGNTPHSGLRHSLPYF
jgi:hypothetical protein